MDKVIVSAENNNFAVSAGYQEFSHLDKPAFVLAVLQRNPESNVGSGLGLTLNEAQIAELRDYLTEVLDNA